MLTLIKKYEKEIINTKTYSLEKSLADKDEEHESRECDDSFFYWDEIEEKEGKGVSSPVRSSEYEGDPPETKDDQEDEVCQTEEEQQPIFTTWDIGTKLELIIPRPMDQDFQSLYPFEAIHKILSSVPCGAF